MRRILVAECKQEVSTFNPVRSHYEDFVVSRGRDIVDYHRARRSEVGGALSVFLARADIEVVPIYAARQITSGGLLGAVDFRRWAEEFLSGFGSAGVIDGVFFSFHGAMAAENEDDPEGYLLAETRNILGEEIPIVVSLDLHGIVTDRMLEHSNAVVMFHTYPHIDFWETGNRAAKLLLRIMAGEQESGDGVNCQPSSLGGAFDSEVKLFRLRGRPMSTAIRSKKSPAKALHPSVKAGSLQVTTPAAKIGRDRKMVRRLSLAKRAPLASRLSATDDDKEADSLRSDPSWPRSISSARISGGRVWVGARLLCARTSRFTRPTQGATTCCHIFQAHAEPPARFAVSA